MNREQAQSANPIIGSRPQDTISSVLPLIGLIQDMTLDPDGGRLSKDATTGLYYVCDIMRNALEFELSALPDQRTEGVRNKEAQS